MDFPKNASTEVKIFLRQNYLDNLERMRSQANNMRDELIEQSKTVKKRITETQKNIERLSIEIADVENTKVD